MDHRAGKLQIGVLGLPEILGKEKPQESKDPEDAFGTN